MRLLLLTAAPLMLLPLIAACDAEIIEPDGAGGGAETTTTSATAGSMTAGVTTGGVTTGGDGGAPPGPFAIELALLGGASPSAEPGAADVTVVVSSPDGSLKQSFSGDELPVQVEVQADDVVGYAWNDFSQNILHTYRITPEVFRIEEVVGGEQQPCDALPMEITVTVPSVATANDYRIAVDGDLAFYTATPGTHTFDVVACDGVFDLFAYARGPGFGGGAVGYEIHQGLTFTPGGSMTIPLDLTNLEYRVLAVEAGPLDGAVGVGSWGFWRYGLDSIPMAAMDAITPIGSPLIEFPIISPGIGTPRALVSADYPAGTGWCHNSTFSRLGETDAVLAFDPRRLANAFATVDGGWELVESGELGDFVRISRDWDDAAWVWIHYEDPSGVPSPSVLPDLPAHLGWPTSAPDLYSVGHEDIVEADGFAAAIAGGLSALEETRTWRVTVRCQ